MFTVKLSGFKSLSKSKSPLHKEYFLSRKEILVLSLPPWRGNEVLQWEGKRRKVRVSGSWESSRLALPPETSGSSFALISRPSIKAFEAVPTNDLLSGNGNLQASRWATGNWVSLTKNCNRDCTLLLETHGRIYSRVVAISGGAERRILTYFFLNIYFRGISLVT